MNSHKKIKVCFLADKHGLYDDRIYWKMAMSLQKKGYEIYYLLITDKEESGTTNEGIHYHSFKVNKYSENRYINYIIKYTRVTTNYDKLLQKAKEIQADVYHFHDLNINKIGKKLKNLSHKPIVIYDVRDPYAQNIRDYIARISKLKPFINMYASYIDVWEKRCAKNYDFIISNEENVRDFFRKVMPSDKVDVIYNYTYLHKSRRNLEKEYDLIYCGGITELRGAFKIIEAIKILKNQGRNIKMLFLGNFFTKNFKEKMKSMIDTYGLNTNIILKDSVPYNDVINYYNKSKIGLGIFLPVKTHEIILQIKIFEYMAMGLPIVASNFGHINDYVLSNDAGLTVDPTKPEEIAKAILKLLNDADLYSAFKKNGINAVEKKYYWELMEQKLFTIYDKLLLNRKNNTINV